MKQSEKTMLEFAGYCFIHKPELANELNTLIADFINKPKEQLILSSVNQQREMLYAFAMTMEFDIKHETYEEDIEYFLKENSSI